MNIQEKKSALRLLLVAAWLTALAALADKICIKATTPNPAKKKVTIAKTVVASNESCPRKFVELIDTGAFLKTYGDGSAGAKTVSSPETLGADAEPNNDPNLQFTDFTVASGVELTVPSGTVIRCTGAFTNNGTITVRTGARGGNWLGGDDSTQTASVTMAEAGVSKAGAGNGELGGSAKTRFYGLGGVGLSEFEARQLRFPGTKAGGGGGAADSNSSTAGKSGGGSLVVLCQGPIVNAGAISANGQSADPSSYPTEGGGGAGGIVILASKTSISQLAGGSISANGGDGEKSDSDQGPSGGGGGGIVHLLAPVISITDPNSITVTKGAAGQNGAEDSVTADVRGGGGGGGACGGNGGNGGSVDADNDPLAAADGTDGHILQTLVDPTSLFS